MKNLYFTVCILACTASAMKKDLIDAMIPLHRVPANGEQLADIQIEHLKSILPANALKSEGVISSLIARPMSSMRAKQGALHLTKSGVKGNHRKNDAAPRDRHVLQAVSLMRSDVSDALGGAYIPGDDIHVAGLDLGEQSLPIGALIVIKSKDTDEIKSILLKTCVEYYANDRFLNRCGQEAYDLMQAEGPYNKGYGAPVHGIRDRLRGVKLAVLKEGEVVVGDRVIIYQNEESEIILQHYKLNILYQNLLTRSMAIGEKISECNRNIKFERYRHYQHQKRGNLCGYFSRARVVTLAALAFGFIMGSLSETVL